MGTVRSAIKMYDGMSPALSSMNKSMNIVLSSFEALQSASSNAIDSSSIKAAREELNKAEIALNQVEDEIREADAAQQKFNNDIRSTGGSASALLSKFKAIAVTMGAAFSAKKIIELSDEMTSTRARLDLMNDGLQTTEELQNKIFQSAQRSRAAYMDTAAVVSKLGILAGEAFSSNEEMIAFAEQMNKQFKIGGASVQEQTAAMYQLTQAMASGRLQGDEFRSIMENAPLLAQSIAEYMGKSVGELREMSSEGLITADVIKNAMFASAAETNAKFAELPITFAQLKTIIGNTLLQTFEPIIQTIGKGAQYIYDNWSTLAPIFWGLTAAVGAYALVLGIQAAAAWKARAAQMGLNLALLSNPIFWVALAIGYMVARIYKWVESVGGIKMAWMIAMDAIQTFTGNAKVAVLEGLQSMVNGAIGYINDFINLLNNIPGVNIKALGELTFAANVAAENAAARKARQNDIEAARREIERNKAQANAGFDWDSLMGNDAMSYLGDTALNTARMADSMETSEEELKYLRDLAERDTINRFTTAEIKLEMVNNNQINSEMDLDGVVTYLEDRLYETMAVAAEGVHDNV